MAPDKGLIVHIITRLEPGGSAQNVIDSAASQAADRKVLLITGPHRGKDQLELRLPQNASLIQIEELIREISPKSDLRAFRRIRSIITEHKPSIVHTHAAKAGILGRWAAWAYNRKTEKGKRAIIVHTPHGHVLYGYFGRVKTLIFKLVERITAQITDHFIALTEGERRESVLNGLGPADKWNVIHSGVKLQESSYSGVRQELGLAAVDTVIAVVARLEPVKGVEYFIRAAAELEKHKPGKDIRYLVVGDGSLMAGLKDLAADSGLEGKIIFTGFQRDVFKYLSAADLYVQPSLNEGMGRTALEAQYMRLPVIASNVCGLPDAVKDGITGLLIPPGDAAALAAAMEKLLRDEGMRRRMGEAGKKWVLGKDFTGYPRFSAESMNVQLKAFYARILSK